MAIPLQLLYKGLAGRTMVSGLSRIRHNGSMRETSRARAMAQRLIRRAGAGTVIEADEESSKRRNLGR
jgi:hypothetical protein